MIGFMHWYRNPPLYVRFTNPDYGEFFFAGEPLPCLMLGSKYAASRKRYGGWWCEEVFEKWIRRTKVSLFTEREVDSFFESPPCCDARERIVNKYGGRPDFGRVLGYESDCSVVINGEIFKIHNKEKLMAIREMRSVELKIGAIKASLNAPR